MESEVLVSVDPARVRALNVSGRLVLAVVEKFVVRVRPAL